VIVNKRSSGSSLTYAVLGLQEILIEELVRLGRHVARVLVEAAEHAVERGVDEVLALGLRLIRFERVLLDHRDDLLDQLEVRLRLDLRVDLRLLSEDQVLLPPLVQRLDVVLVQVRLGQPTFVARQAREALELAPSGLDIADLRHRQRAERAQLRVARREELHHLPARLALSVTSALRVQRDRALQSEGG
jgi:hypothetical protein